MFYKKQGSQVGVCKECLAKLEKAGVYTRGLYIKVCESFIEGKPFIIKDGAKGNGNGNCSVKYLEKYNYIVSLDIGSNNLALRPNMCMRESDETIYFCGNYKTHGC